MNNYLKINLLDCILIILLYFLSRFIIEILNAGIDIFDIDYYLILPISTILVYLLTFISYYLLCMQPKNQKLNIIKYSAKDIKTFPFALLLFLGAYLTTEYITGLIPTKGVYFGKMYESMTNNFATNLNDYPIVSFILICIIAPIFEELFFRGFILKGLLNNKTHPIMAIIISSLIFGVLHLYPWQIVGGFLMGLFLGLIYYKTGSLLYPTLLHFTNNLSGFLLYNQYKTLELPNLGINKLVILAIGVILILIFGHLFLKLTKKNKWNFY